jgi:hypothetical protein
MEPEYRSMREVMARNRFRDEVRGSESGGLVDSRPPWKVPGKSSAALPNPSRLWESPLDPAGRLSHHSQLALKFLSHRLPGWWLV